MTCHSNEFMTICTPGKLARKVIGRTNKKWCFKCRARFVHDKVVYSEILVYDEDNMPINGYYEPFLKYECRNCHEEHYEFAS